MQGRCRSQPSLTTARSPVRANGAHFGEAVGSPNAAGEDNDFANRIQHAAMPVKEDANQLQDKSQESIIRPTYSNDVVSRGIEPSEHAETEQDVEEIASRKRIEESIENLKRERQGLMLSAMQSKPPSGMSRSELKEWRLDQASKARAYLSELEQRLQRLQIMGSKLQSFAATRQETERLYSSLPNTVNNISDDAGARYDAEPVESHALNLLENELDLELSLKRRKLNEPLSGHEIRDLFRDEISRCLTSADIASADLSLEEKFSYDSIAPKKGHPRELKATEDLPAKPREVWRDSDSDASDLSEFMQQMPAPQEKRHSIRYEEVTYPRNLQEAVAQSCPMCFGGFSRRSPFRLKCFEIYSSPMWNAFFALMSIATTLFIAIDPSDSGKVLQESDAPYETTTSKVNTRVENVVGISAGQIFDYLCVFFLAFEIAIGCIAVGFYSAQSTWLRCSDLHKLDMLILLSCIGEYVGAGYGFRSLTLRPLRILRILTPLLKFGSFVGMKMIFTGLHQAGPALFFLAFVLSVFLLIFSILGVTILEGSFRRICVVDETRIPSCASDYTTGWNDTCTFKNQTLEIVKGTQEVVTGGYPFERACKVWNNHSSLSKIFDSYYYKMYGDSDSCEAGEHCIETENPMHGLQHFDHIGGAVLAVLQGCGMDGFEYIIHRSLESEPLAKPLLWILWAFLTAISAILSVSIFKAVVIVHIREVRSQHALAMFDTFGHESSLIENVQEDADDVDALRPATPRSEADKSAEHIEVDENSKEPVEVPQKGKFWDESILAGGDLSGGKIQLSAQMLANDRKTKWFLTFSIMLNLLAVGFDQWDTSQTISRYCFLAKLACLFIFVCESLLRFTIAGDLRNYWNSNANRFELVVNICAAAAFIFQSANFLDTMPVLRMYRIMHNFPSMRILIFGCLSSVRSIIALGIVMITIGIAFAVIGRYVIGDKMNDISRSNFGTFQTALLTIFKLFTGDQWSSILYDAMSARTTTVGQVFVAAFLVFWIFFSKLIIYPMFVAIVLENFPQTEIIKATKGSFGISDLISFFVTRFSTNREPAPVLDDADKIKAKQIELYYLTSPAHAGKISAEEENVDQAAQRRPKSKKLMILLSHATTNSGSGPDVPERTLYMFDVDNFIRRACVELTDSAGFQLVAVTVIVISSCTLVLTPPYKDIPNFQQLISYRFSDFMNIFTTIFFTAEFAIKSIAQGLLLTQNALLRTGWGVIDSIIIFFAWIQLLNVLPNGTIAKIFRLVRVLAPFIRLVKHVRSIRVIFESLVLASRPLVYVCTFSFTVLAFFALLGMALMGGKMFRCTAENITYPEGIIECSGSFTRHDDGLHLPRAWISPTHNFDSFSFAFLTLFRISMHKFSAIIADAVDVTGYGSSPLTNNFELCSLYFIIYIIFGVLLVINIFGAYIIDSFVSSEGVTPAQIFYNRISSQLQRYRPRYQKFKYPEHRICVRARKILSTDWFKQFSSACILTNIVFMLLTHEGASEVFNNMLLIQNQFFFGELVFEIVLYLVAYGPAPYMEDKWRMMELFMACGSLYGYVESAQQGGGAPFYIFFQCLRIFRFIPDLGAVKSRPLRVIVETVLTCAPQLPFIFMIIFLVYAVFASLAVQFFATTKYGILLGPASNFDNWFSSLLTLYQIFSGNDWMDIMDDCSVEPPFCTKQFTPLDSEGYDGPSYSFGDCGSGYASLYFLALKIICEMAFGNYRFLNDESTQVEDEFWSRGASSRQIIELSEVFRRFDSGTSYINVSRLRGLKYALPYPLGIDLSLERRMFMHKNDKLRKVAWKLIRAEFDVILRDRRTKMEENEQTWMGNAYKVLGLGPDPRAKNGLNFHESMMTILHWRIPLMVPHNVKSARSELITEVVITSHALTIVDFLRRCVSLRKRVETSKLLDLVSRVRGWSKSDPASIRRRQLLQDVNLGIIKFIIEDDSEETRRFAVPQSRNHTITFKAYKPETEADLVSHPKALSDNNVQYFTPTDGLRVFLVKLRTNSAVFKFSDAVNKDRQLYVADFTKCGWTGWKKVESSTDALLRCADLKLMRKRRSGGAYADIDLVIPIKGNESATGPRRNSAVIYNVVCRLVDVQSFSRPEMGGRTKPAIRLNLAPRTTGNESLYFDGVLELVGYLSK